MPLVLAFACVPGCASEVIPTYGDPAQVAGGVGGAGTTSTGGAGGSTQACEVDPQCGVSFQDDVFPILDRAGNNGCATTDGAPIGCHSESSGNLTLTAGDAASYFTGLTGYTLNKPPAVGPYIVPCDPQGSKILCNLKISDGDNPNGTCGATMPLVPANAPTLDELQTIEEWIACGAPNN